MTVSSRNDLHKLDATVAVPASVARRLFLRANLVCGDRPIAEAMAEEFEKALDALERVDYQPRVANPATWAPAPVSRDYGVTRVKDADIDRHIKPGGVFGELLARERAAAREPDLPVSHDCPTCGIMQPVDGSPGQHRRGCVDPCVVTGLGVISSVAGYGGAGKATHAGDRRGAAMRAGAEWIIDDDGRHVRRIGAFELVIASDSGGTGWWWRVSVGSEDIRTGQVAGSPYDTRAIVEAAAAECGLRVDGAP